MAEPGPMASRFILGWSCQDTGVRHANAGTDKGTRSVRQCWQSGGCPKWDRYQLKSANFYDGSRRSSSRNILLVWTWKVPCMSGTATFGSCPANKGLFQQGCRHATGGWFIRIEWKCHKSAPGTCSSKFLAVPGTTQTCQGRRSALGGTRSPCKDSRWLRLCTRGTSLAFHFDYPFFCCLGLRLCARAECSGTKFRRTRRQTVFWVHCWFIKGFCFWFMLLSWGVCPRVWGTFTFRTFCRESLSTGPTGWVGRILSWLLKAFLGAGSRKCPARWAFSCVVGFGTALLKSPGLASTLILFWSPFLSLVNTYQSLLKLCTRVRVWPGLGCALWSSHRIRLEPSPSSLQALRCIHYRWGVSCREISGQLCLSFSLHRFWACIAVPFRPLLLFSQPELQWSFYRIIPWSHLCFSSCKTGTRIPTVLHTRFSVIPWLLNVYLSLEQKLKKVSFDFVKLWLGFNNEKTEIGVGLELGLPVLEGVQVLFFVHVLTGLSKLLVVNDVDIRTLFALLLDSACVLFEALGNQFLIDLSA